MSNIDARQLYEWCRIPVDQLENQKTKIPFRMVTDSAAMGELMARELVDDIKTANRERRPFRVIVPCGPKSWYAPFTRIVNDEKVSLKKVTVFHMDECLDWQCQLLPETHPLNFRSFMEEHFYGGIPSDLSVPAAQRFFPSPSNVTLIETELSSAPIDLTIGGFGQDGHIAYNQAPRHPYINLSIEDLRHSRIRIQENNIDTILALGHRNFGGAYQFVPPMSVTLGISECLSAKEVRLYSDTGDWKQTAFRVALFSEETVEYPMTLLQNHPKALVTVTRETASHPISLNEWDLFGDTHV